MELTYTGNHFIFSKGHFSVFEKRVLYAIIDTISPYLRHKLDNKKGDELLFEKFFVNGIKRNLASMSYKASDVCTPDSYGYLRDALKSLAQSVIEIDTKKDWRVINIIANPVFEKGSETFGFMIDFDFFEMVLDYEKIGYSKLQIKTALALPSFYSMKIYELLCKWRNCKDQVFDISIGDLRQLTETIGKYNQIGEFKKNVINIAKKHLNESDITDLRFDYKDVKHGRKIVGFKIFIKKTNKSYEVINEQKELDKNTFEMLSPSHFFEKLELDMLERIGYDLKQEKFLKVAKEFKAKCIEKGLDMLDIIETEKNKQLKNGKRIDKPVGFVYSIFTKHIFN